jgi:hypothetical protein
MYLHHNSFKIKKYWHHVPIFNNIGMNINPGLIIQHGDFMITIDGNVSSLLD